MKRDVQILDGWPETITLPRAEQFISGRNTDEKNCGCLWGHVAYAFGLIVLPFQTCGFELCDVALRENILKFARDILKELTGESVSRIGFPIAFDAFYRDNHDAGKKTARAWRIVADRHGYDVKASEPRWRP